MLSLSINEQKQVMGGKVTVYVYYKNSKYLVKKLEFDTKEKADLWVLMNRNRDFRYGFRVE